MRIVSGISIRESQVKSWLGKAGFIGEYLLISTKPDSIYSRRLEGVKAGQKLIVDLYTPVLLEKELTLSKWKPRDWLTRWRNKKMVKKFLERGDHFLVANRRQREYWIKAVGDLGVKLTEKDISVLPTGAGKLSVNGYRLTVIDRKVVLWFGGIYPWMDPMPLVEAFSQISSRFPDWKLRFLGGWHPETGYKGIYGRLKEFSKRMVPPDQLEFIPWQSENNLIKYFADVAFAVHLVKPTLEDYYAHRVRLLTLLEAGIPVITGGKDVVSDLIDEIKAGVKVEGFVEDLASKLETVMSDSKILDTWRLQAPMVWKLLKKRECILVKWRKMPSDRIKNCRKI